MSFPKKRRTTITLVLCGVFIFAAVYKRETTGGSLHNVLKGADAIRNFFGYNDGLPPHLHFDDSELSGHFPVRTSFDNSKVVFYNRVPKCGSTTMIWTLRRLTKKLKFNLLYIDQHNVNSRYGDRLEEVIAQAALNPSHDSLVVSQLPHVNFTKFGLEYPIYINVVRDPADRLVSSYYYIRFGFKKRQGKVNLNRPRKNFTDEERNMSFNDCILRKGKECMEYILPLFPFFCGFDTVCGERSKYAMQQSKVNAAKYYAVIGLLEDVPNTLKVLEAVFPRYFKNVKNIYFSSPEIDGSKTYRKEPANAEVRSRLRHLLQHEYEFYDFVKARFYKQLAMLKEEGKIS